LGGEIIVEVKTTDAYRVALDAIAEYRRTDKTVPQFVPVDFHAACIRRIEESLKRSLVKQTRATYSSPDGALVVVCAVSRAHLRDMYWYAFHPHQKEKLEAAKEGYVAYEGMLPMVAVRKRSSC
jgi:hypothetical protein